MGVEWQLLRNDNKTIFDLNKSLGYEILEVIFSQEQLLEYLLLWQIAMWERGSDPMCVLVIRDRLLDFVEGAGLNDLKVVSDSWFDSEQPEILEYSTTHDRFIIKDDIDRYYELLTHTHIEEYTKNPLDFFRKSGAAKGRYLKEANERKERLRKYINRNIAT